MGKKGDKEKEAKKKETKAAKQAAKTAKSTKKKVMKGEDEVEEDIEKILAELAVAEAKKTAVHVTVVERPSARANFSLTALPTGELIMFGGEFWNGQHNTCYNELLRYAPATNEWKMVTSPSTPPHRCSHQSVLMSSGSAYNMYVFGGEFATNMQFYHYADTWKLEIASNKWTRLECKKSPSARSGHRMVAWRNFIILFGGFHQSYTSDAWFKDLWAFDTRTNEWKEIVLPGNVQQPSARSAFQFQLVPGKDIAILYGGYSEVKQSSEVSSIVAPGKGKGASAAAAMIGKKTRSVVHTDLWILKLAPLIGSGLPTWERIRYSGAAPSARLGFSMAMYRDRAILFGGVSDKDADERGEVVESVFYNDMYSYDMDRRRWYKLELKKSKAAGSRRAKNTKKSSGGAGDDDDDRVSLGSAGDEGSEDEDEFRLAAGHGTDAKFDENAFYYYQDGKLVKLEVEDYEDVAESEVPPPSTAENGAVPAVAANSEPGAAVPSSEPSADVPPSALSETDGAEVALATSIKKKKKKMTEKFDFDEGVVTPVSPTTPGAPASGPGPASDSTKEMEPVQPNGRMKASTWIDGHWFYLYGGMAEGRSREITYDDLWKIDLRDRIKWECVMENRPHEWRGDDSDDEGDSEEEDSEEDDEDDEDSEGGDEESDEDAEGTAAGAGDEKSRNTAGRHARGHGHGASKENARLRELRAKLGVEDASVTPQPGERLGVFFARTADKWITEYMAHHLMEGERIEGKQLRKKAFTLAKVRYDELWPILEELYELEEEQRKLEEEAAASKKRPGPKAKGR